MLRHRMCSTAAILLLVMLSVIKAAGDESLPRLAGVAWAAVNDNAIRSNLDETIPPESPAPEGWALYPDKDAPDDVIEHGVVAIRARLDPPRAGVPVYFRVFDVDDPADDPRLDPNSDWGGDNDLATTPGAPGLILPSPGVTLLEDSALAAAHNHGTFTLTARTITNTAGEAEILWQASRQPGDNFRAAAILAPGDAAALALLDAVSTRGLALDASPAAAPGQYAATPLLTVHRRLWIAIDRMAPPPQYEPITGRLLFGSERGTVSAIDRHTTKTHIYYLASDDMASTWTLRPGMYQDSIWLPYERACYLQPDLTHNAYFNILGIEQRVGRPWLVVRTDWRFINTIEGWYLQQQPTPIALHDRATTGSTYRIVTEDGNVAPQFPTINHARRVFARCYIAAAADPRLGGRTLPFIRNATNDDIAASGRDIRGADPLYWQCYLLGAYEYTVLEDGDPDWHAMAFYTPVTEGVTARQIPQDYRYTAIFYEMARENWAAAQDVTRFLDEKITAHELIHQFDIRHTSGIMEEFAEYREPWLHAPDVARIRATRAP